MGPSKYAPVEPPSPGERSLGPHRAADHKLIRDGQHLESMAGQEYGCAQTIVARADDHGIRRAYHAGRSPESRQAESM